MDVEAARTSPIEIGRRDMSEAIEKTISTNGNVVQGMRVEEIENTL